MKKILLIILTISFCGLTACKTGTKKGGDMDKETLVKIETTLGDIEVKLYNETPKHRDNFIKLVKDGVYEGTVPPAYGVYVPSPSRCCAATGLHR